MDFLDLNEGQVYFLPVRILKLLPIQERIKICEKIDEKTGEQTIVEEAAQGYPFPPYVALWDGRCRYIGEDVYKHLMSAREISDRLQEAMSCKEKRDFLT